MWRRKLCRCLNDYQDSPIGLFRNMGKAIGGRQNVPLFIQKTIEERLRILYSREIEVNMFKNVGRKLHFRKKWRSCLIGVAVSVPCQDVKYRIKKGDIYHLACNCDTKFPCQMQFLLDQRTARKIKIAWIDMKVTMMMEADGHRVVQSPKCGRHRNGRCFWNAHYSYWRNSVDVLAGETGLLVLLRLHLFPDMADIYMHRRERIVGNNCLASLKSQIKQIPTFCETCQSFTHGVDMTQRHLYFWHWECVI